MRLDTDQHESITVIRSDLATSVDRLMADVYTPEHGFTYTREQVERAMWAWLYRAVNALIEDADDFTHSVHPYRSQWFREALTEAAKGETVNPVPVKALLACIEGQVRRAREINYTIAAIKLSPSFHAVLGVEQLWPIGADCELFGIPVVVGTISEGHFEIVIADISLDEEVGE